MAADHFCLKWNNFQASIINAFESLQTTEDLADVTLTCEGLNVKAHKIILSAFSSYFRTVFKENPCPHPIVILKDVLHADLLAVLNFMYHGEVLILKDQLPSFLQTAEILQVSGLAGCGNFHIKNVTPAANKHKPPKQPGCKSKEIMPETMSKKAKLVKKAKSPLPIVDRTSANSEKGSKVQHLVDKIKMEVDDDKSATEVDDVGTETMSPDNVQDVLSNTSSILERSLMSLAHAKPNVAYTAEQQHKADLTRTNATSYIPEKPPESAKIEHHGGGTDQLQQKPNLDSEKKTATRPIVEGESHHGSAKEFALCPDAAPHHSSQCGNCPHCGKVYSNQSALKYHVRLVHSDLTNMYCCHLCPEAFDYREGYKRHMVEAHNIRN